MALVEEIFEAASARSATPAPAPEGRPTARHALWICACVTGDDAPMWLIYDTDEDGVAWCRVPDAVEPRDLVDAALIAGGHADPSSVLLWLLGQAPEPWAGGESDGDREAIDALGRKVVRSGASDQ